MTTMPAKKPIGFLGAGRMAQALARGVAESETFRHSPVSFVDPNDESSAGFQAVHQGAVRVNQIRELAERSSLIILAVKPQTMPAVLPELREAVHSDHLIVSVAAGVSIETYRSALGIDRIIRVMPNTPCLVGMGMSAIAVGPSVSDDDRIFVHQLMESVGKVVLVDESNMDAVTGLSGSGPAYVFSFIKALIDGGINQGLDADTAKCLSLQTVMGAAYLIEKTGLPPGQLTEQVTSPGGTTLAGLESLDRDGFEEAVKNAIAAATCRSIELSGT